MTRIASAIARTKEQKEVGLIAYIMAGDPTMDDTLHYMHALVEGGAHMIELGMPFTDPVADGPVIERAARRALAAHTRIADIADLIKKFRQTNTQTPVILMGYYNPICHMGIESFVMTMQNAGVDGLLVVDLPPEEDAELLAMCDKHMLALIKLVTPTTDDDRLSIILEKARGFVYYVSVAGITGRTSGSTASIADSVARIKQGTDLPVVVGFGIKTAQDVKTMAKTAIDAVVVGSAIVDRIANGQSAHEITRFVAQLKP